MIRKETIIFDYVWLCPYTKTKKPLKNPHKKGGTNYQTEIFCVCKIISPHHKGYPSNNKKIVKKKEYYILASEQPIFNIYAPSTNKMGLSCEIRMSI